MHDQGTSERDALVRYPGLDDGDLRGYAVVDTDGTPTLTFAARALDIG
jgi:hypothetical protein